MKRFAALVITICLVAVAAYEAMFWYEHVHEAGARVQANFTVLASSVNGKLSTLHAQRGDLVEAGQLLASMDSRRAELDVLALEAELERQRASRTEAEAELDQFRAGLGDRIATARAEWQAISRTYETANERHHIARKNVERNSALESRSIVARERVDEANDRLLEMTGRLRQLQSDMKMSEMRLAELHGLRKREAVFQSRIAIIDRDIDKTAVALDIARQELADMQVKSPIRGVLNRIYVNPGTYVEDGDRLLLLHDPDDLWIEADIAESDIRLVKIGQPVLIELDAYPYEEFRGTVSAIGQVTVGQMAAAAGAQAGSGAQRVQVEIALPDIGRPVWPGMRAAVNIVVR